MMRFQVATAAVATADVVVTNSLGVDSGRVGREMQAVLLPALETTSTYNCYDTSKPEYQQVSQPDFGALQAITIGPEGLGAAFYFAGKDANGTTDIPPPDMPLQHQGTCGTADMQSGTFFSNYMSYGVDQNATFANRTLDAIFANDNDATKAHDATLEADQAGNNLCVFANAESNDTSMPWWLSNANVTRDAVEKDTDNCKQQTVNFADGATDGALFWCKLPAVYYCIMHDDSTTTMAPSTSECHGDSEDDTGSEEQSSGEEPVPASGNAAAVALTAVAALLMA